MALFNDFTETVRKAFLAGVGAVSVGAEKSQELVEDLIKRGELTVEQGKALNDDLMRKVKETANGASEEMLRARLRSMSIEERAAWLARAKKIAEDLEADDASYEVEPEVEAEEEPEADVEPEPEADVEDEPADEPEPEPEPEADVEPEPEPDPEPEPAE